MRLFLAIVLILGATVSTAYFGESSTWQYYVTVDECLENTESWGNSRLRVSGTITAGSLHISSDRRTASFALEGARDRLLVNYRGIVPDNLAEACEVVVEGQMKNNQTLVSHQVLTRCASKYASDVSRGP